MPIPKPSAFTPPNSNTDNGNNSAPHTDTATTTKATLTNSEVVDNKSTVRKTSETTALTALLKQVVCDFRCSREARGNAGYQTLLDMMTQQYGQTANSLQHQQINQRLVLFQQMLAAQQRQDWLSLADTLEYELAPLLTATEAGQS